MLADLPGSSRLFTALERRNGVNLDQLRWGGQSLMLAPVISPIQW